MSEEQQSSDTGKSKRGLFDALKDNSRVIENPVANTVPNGLRIAAAYSWRILLIIATIGVIIIGITKVSLLVIPILAAVLLTALLWPAMSILLRWNFPKWLAVVSTILLAIAVVVGMGWLAVWQIGAQWASVQQETVSAINDLRTYLIDGPLHLTAADIDAMLAQIGVLIQEQTEWLLSGAIAIGSTVGSFATGSILTIFILICFLADGKRIWSWTNRLFPKASRTAVNAAATAGWGTVVNYARTQLLVAFIDAIGIGLGAFLLGVPLAVPIAILVFLGAFVPFVGAIVTGVLAVFLALVYNGPWIALWMLVVVLAVQQIEGHILQPILMGTAVKVHPLAVVLVVSGGAMLAGIAGALFAVPVAAFINVVVITITRKTWLTGKEPGPNELIWSTVPAEPPLRGAR